MQSKKITIIWIILVSVDVIISQNREMSKSALLRQAIETVIFPGTYPNCSSVNFKNEYRSCQIRDLSDEKQLVCQGREECIHNEHMHVTPCPDGSIAKTCTQVSTPSVYVCVCQSAPRTVHKAGKEFCWVSDPDTSIPNLENGNVFYRRLCHDGGGEDHCFVEEKLRLHYLVVHLEIRDDAISASSYWKNREDHAAKRVRLGQYTSYACGWAAWLKNDPTPWVQFDMGVAVTVWGLLLKKRCDPPYNQQRVLSCDVTFSHDGDAWMTAAENLVAPYPDGRTSVVWFQQPIKGHYWRIHPLTWDVHPSMKADLIGRIHPWIPMSGPIWMFRRQCANLDETRHVTRKQSTCSWRFGACYFT